MHEAFKYLEDVKTIPESSLENSDGLDETAVAISKSYKDEEEKIFSSNQFGTGFGQGDSSDSPGTYEPQALNARHREIIRLAALGYKHTQIGAMLSVSPVTVGYTINSPLGQAYLAEIEEARTGSVKDVHNRLQEMSPFAAEVMLDIMANSNQESNKLRAAEKVLEMTGHKADNKNLHVHTHLSPDEIKNIKAQVKGGPEVVEEVSYTEDNEEGDEQEASQNQSTQS